MEVQPLLAVAGLDAQIVSSLGGELDANSRSCGAVRGAGADVNAASGGDGSDLLIRQGASPIDRRGRTCVLRGSEYSGNLCLLRVVVLEQPSKALRRGFGANVLRCHDFSPP